MFAYSPTVISCLVKFIRYGIQSLYSLVLLLYRLSVTFIRINKLFALFRKLRIRFTAPYRLLVV